MSNHKDPIGPMGPRYHENEADKVKWLLGELWRYRVGAPSYRDSDGNLWCGLEHFTLIQMEEALKNYQTLLSQPIYELIDWEGLKPGKSSSVRGEEGPTHLGENCCISTGEILQPKHGWPGPRGFSPGTEYRGCPEGPRGFSPEIERTTERKDKTNE